MSCQQATRLITTPSPVIPEDPYVFTDTVSTPPILFNTQKSARARLTDIQIATTGLTLPARSISNQQKISFAQLNDNLPKAQASLAESLIGTVTQAISPITTTANITSLKNSSQCPKQIHKVQIKQPLQQQNNIIQSSNLCIIRLQNQSSNQSTTQLLQHTPSLWQTPLILDTTPLVSPPTSPASLPSPTTSSATTTTPPAMGIITTQAVVTSQATSLPPSNFHHTTVAQHLQKLQCIKNTKKGTAVNNTNKLNTNTEEAQQLNAFICASEPPPLHALEQRKHSDTDLHEVSVKTISSKPESPQEIPQKNLNGNSYASHASIAEQSRQKFKLLEVSLPASLTADNKSDISNSLSAANSCEFQQSTQVPKLLQLRKVDETVDTLNDQFIEPSINSQLQPKSNNFAKHNLSSNQNIQNVSSSNIVDSKRDILTNEVKKRVPADTPSKEVSSIQATAKILKKNYSNEKFANQSQTSLGQKKNRKIRVNGFNAKKALSDNHGPSSKKAVTVVRITEQNTDVDISLLTASYILPYCIQENCINFEQKKNNVGEHCSAQSGNLAREERIQKYKNLLQRQALQLFSVRSMQKYPLHVARQRLLCVDRMLRKYKDVFDEKQTVNRCSVPSCNDQALDMATYCVKHIVKNPAQSLFSYCSAKLPDNTQCPISVFDIMNDIPLCNEHALKREEYTLMANEQRKMSTVSLTPQNQRSGGLQQETHIGIANSKKLNITKLATPRKRKVTLVNPIGRPQKRNKKMQSNAVEPKVVPVSAVLQRKSSTTSLESIASNSHSSNSQLYMPSNSLAPPALAPLSYSGNMISPQRKLNFGTLDANANTNDDKKAHDINQIVAQFTMLANKHEGNNINHSNGLFNNNNNMNFMNTNSNSNFTSGLGSTSSIPSTDELLTQDMLSMCENSSAYASSEDTGLGGLSESEIIPGPQDDDIPLDDTHLLEENDLDNVLNSLPVDAFNELFTAVRQDECDEVERALALADKHLKSLQQTIGSDSDFLGDFLDVNEDFLNDEDICSNIDTSALFIDSGTNGGTGGGTSGNCSTITDVRGLVQT